MVNDPLKKEDVMIKRSDIGELSIDGGYMINYIVHILY